MIVVPLTFKGWLLSFLASGYIAFCVGMACSISSVLFQQRHPILYVVSSAALSLLITSLGSAIYHYWKQESDRRKYGPKSKTKGPSD